MNDLNRTQHYTTNASYITNGLLDFIPPNAILVEPFCGAGDLVALFPNHKWEKYDIEPKTPDTISLRYITFAAKLSREMGYN